MSEERKVVKAWSPSGTDGRHTLAFASNTDIVYDKDTGLMLNQILTVLDKKIEEFNERTIRYGRYIKALADSDWELNSSDNKYHFTLTATEHHLNGVVFARVMIEDDDGNLTFNYGLVDGRDYNLIYKQTGDIEIISSTIFKGKLIINSYNSSHEFIFNTDSWVNESDSYVFSIPASTHGITNPIVTALSIKNEDASYRASYGLCDDIDYNVKIDNSGNVSIYTGTPFSGKIILEGI